MIPLLIESHYLPCIEYFAYLYYSDSIYIEVHENYVKQTHRNRCSILGANHIINLSVPIINTHSKVAVKDIRIDYSQKWVNVHWRTIRSAYGKAPFFEYYSSYFEEILFKKSNFLIDLNTELLELCIKLLGITPSVEFTKKYEEKTSLYDMRMRISPKERSVNYDKIALVKYTQVFGSTFEANLSIVDLLFNEGKNASQILKLYKIV